MAQTRNYLQNNFVPDTRSREAKQIFMNILDQAIKSSLKRSGMPKVNLITFMSNICHTNFLNQIKKNLKCRKIENIFLFPFLCKYLFYSLVADWLITVLLRTTKVEYMKRFVFNKMKILQFIHPYFE